MKVLVACEYSGRVRQAFRERGHEAYSVDILPCLDNSPYHYTSRIEDVLYNVGFKVEWDLMIAHPPCTHLCSSGARWFKDKQEVQEEAIEFVKLLMNAPIERIAIENPVGILSSRIRKPDQIVQPYWFGDSFKKTTCLWLKNLPPLTPTNMVDPGEFVIHGGKKLPKWYSNREFARDLTFPGMAAAMAEQWGNLERD